MSRKNRKSGKLRTGAAASLVITFFLFFSFCPVTASIPGDPEEIKFPEIAGWQLVQDYPVYYPESLWDYINGAAEAYLSYLFTDLHIAEYVHADGTIIKAEVYRHKSPEYAFGIYSQERIPEYDFQPFGTQGYSEESLVHFITSKYYVKVTSNSTGEEVREFMPIVARRVAESLGEPGPLPSALKLFPEKDRINHSEKFIADNFLGHDFISRVFTVDYTAGKDHFTQFLLQRDSGEECRKILESYYKFTGQVVELDQGLHTVTDKYNGTIHLVWEDTNLRGVINAPDPDTGKKFLELMGEQIGH